MIDNVIWVSWMDKSALIIGAGNGISGAFARELFAAIIKFVWLQEKQKISVALHRETEAMICDVDCTSSSIKANIFKI